MRQIIERLSIGVVACLLGLMMTGHSLAAELQLPLESMERYATVVYVSPGGAGTADGSSAANALSMAQVESFVKNLDQSTKLVMLPGEYPITRTLSLSSPSNDSVLVVDGEDAVLKGTFNFTTETVPETGIRLKTGNIIIRGLEFENTKICIKADKYSRVDQVLIEDIAARNVHSCILVDNGVTREVSRWIIRDSSIQGYYRVGVRLAGAQSHDFLVANLQIDGAHGYAASDCYKGGIQLLSGVRNVHIRDSSIENNIGTCENYQQGDGIEADHKQGTPTNLLFENLKVANSGDAELDLKAAGVKMSNMMLLGGDLSRYAIKVWSYQDYWCHNCIAYGINKAFINLNQASMTFSAANFSSSTPVPVCDLRHGTTAEERSTVSFQNSQIYVGSEEWANECGPGALATVERLPLGKFIPPSPVSSLQIH